MNELHIANICGIFETQCYPSLFYNLDKDSNERLFILSGGPGSGKSVFINVLSSLLCDSPYNTAKLPWEMIDLIYNDKFIRYVNQTTYKTKKEIAGELTIIKKTCEPCVKATDVESGISYEYRVKYEYAHYFQDEINVRKFSHQSIGMIFKKDWSYVPKNKLTEEFVAAMNKFKFAQNKQFVIEGNCCYLKTLNNKLVPPIHFSDSEFKIFHLIGNIFFADKFDNKVNLLMYDDLDLGLSEEWWNTLQNILPEILKLNNLFLIATAKNGNPQFNHNISR